MLIIECPVLLFDFRLKCNSSSAARADQSPDQNPGEDFQNKAPGQKLNVHFIQIHVKTIRLMKTGGAEGLKQILISTDSPVEHESKALWEAFSSAANCEQSKDVKEPPCLDPLCSCLSLTTIDDCTWEQEVCVDVFTISEEIYPHAEALWEGTAFNLSYLS